MENPNTLGLLEETLEVANATLNTIERLACRLYDIQTENDVNVPKNNKVLSRENAGSSAINTNSQ